MKFIHGSLHTTIQWIVTSGMCQGYVLVIHLKHIGEGLFIIATRHSPFCNRTEAAASRAGQFWCARKTPRHGGGGSRSSSQESKDTTSISGRFSVVQLHKVPFPFENRINGRLFSTFKTSMSATHLPLSWTESTEPRRNISWSISPAVSQSSGIFQDVKERCNDVPLTLSTHFPS